MIEPYPDSVLPRIWRLPASQSSANCSNVTEDGRANEAVLRRLADTLSLPRRSVTLVSGHGARDKIVELAGVGPALIERRLSSATASDRRKDRRV